MKLSISGSTLLDGGSIIAFAADFSPRRRPSLSCFSQDEARLSFSAKAAYKILHWVRVMPKSQLAEIIIHKAPKDLLKTQKNSRHMKCTRNKARIKRRMQDKRMQDKRTQDKQTQDKRTQDKRTQDKQTQD